MGSGFLTAPFFKRKAAFSRVSGVTEYDEKFLVAALRPKYRFVAISLSIFSFKLSKSSITISEVDEADFLTKLTSPK